MFSRDRISSGLAEALCSQQMECLTFVSCHLETCGERIALIPTSPNHAKTLHRKGVLCMYVVLRGLGIVMRWACC